LIFYAGASKLVYIEVVGMKKTAFICYGDQSTEQAFVYNEIPRREGGEEFFVFFNPRGSVYRENLKEFFRLAISTSRMGSAENYFIRFLKNAEEKLDSNIDINELLDNSIILLMIRRGAEIYFMHNRGIKALHWDGSAREIGNGGVFSRIRIDRDRGIDQADLFSRSLYESFTINVVRETGGTHTLVFVPSEEFAARHRETFMNSVLFPSFEVPDGRGVPADTGLDLPAIHWSGEEKSDNREERLREKMKKRRFSIPVISGIAAAIAAYLIFFGPFSGRDQQRAEDNILLSAEDSRVESGNNGDASSGHGETDPVEDQGGRSGSGQQSPGDRRTPSTVLRIEKLWSKKFDKGVTSSPAYCGGNVVFGCRDGHVYAFTPEGDFKWKYFCEAGVGSSPVRIPPQTLVACDYNGSMHCLNAAGGDLRWKVSLGDKIISTPSVHDGRIYAGTMGGNVFSISADEGRIHWKKRIGSSVWSSIETGDDYLIAASVDGHLVRMTHDGEVEWKTDPGGEIYSTPLCVESEDLLIIGTNKNLISAVSLSEGSLLWQYSVSSQVRGVPSTDGERIIIGTDDGKVYALSLEGRMLWMQGLGQAVRSKPLIFENQILITGYNGKLNAIDKISGNIAGTYRAESRIYSSPLKVGDRIFFGTNGGFFHSVEISSD